MQLPIVSALSQNINIAPPSATGAAPTATGVSTTNNAQAAATPMERAAANSLAFWRTPAPPAPRDLTAVCRLSENTELRRMATAEGLDIVEVAWEDMSRWQNSADGNNITDATLRVKGFAQRCSILRAPNFTDRTADFHIGQFNIKTGNETGMPLRLTPLRSYLNTLFNKAGGPPEALAPDHPILVAPQTCVLPLENGACTFNMELFNYQTSHLYPTSLAVVCTAEGTSAQIVTERGAQKLFFNRSGKAADFVAERLKHVRQREGRAIEGAMNAEEEERNMLLLFQIPLQMPARLQRSPWTSSYGMPLIPPPGSASKSAGRGMYVPTQGSAATSNYGAAPSYGAAASYGATPSYGAAASYGATPGYYAPSSSATGRRLPPAPGSASPRTPVAVPAPQQGVDHAQLGVGPSHSSFKPLPRLFNIDPDAAIRCTVQHYLVTDEGSLGAQELRGTKKMMDAIYGQGQRVGSLVVDADAATRRTAPTTSQRFWFLS